MDETCMEISKHNSSKTVHLQKECTLEDFAQNHMKPTSKEEIFCQVVKVKSKF